MCKTRKSTQKPMARNIATGGDRQAYKTFSKHGWNGGPWRNELDKAVWTDPATGLDCMHRRCADGGYLCGYVAVEPGHPLFGFDHDAIPASFGVTAHNGLVESGLCDHGREDEVMCHIPAPGRPDDVWWFGFKCNMVDDHLPASGRARSGDQSGIYRSTDYVRAECAKLAMQLARLALDCGAPLALPAPVEMPTITPAGQRVAA